MVDGIVDFLEENNINVFWPNKGIVYEGLKYLLKILCKKYQIPTAKFGIFKNIKDALHFSNNA